MKKVKLLLSTIVGFLLAFVMVFSVACNNKDNSNKGNVKPAPEVPEKPAGDIGITQGAEDETLSLLGIEVVTFSKTQYKLGETYDPDGLSIRATYLDRTITPDPLDPNANLVTDYVNASEYTVDSSNFDSSKVGVYTIYVSYTYLGVTRTTSYTVSVAAEEPAYGGIVAKLADGKQDTYSLSAGSASVTINKDILAVYEIGTNGEPAATPLDAELYDADLYLGSKKIADNAATENGVYSFVATLKADKSQQDFIPVYVVNTVSSIELVSGVGKFEQEEGKDTISSTWSFKVTYSNGATKTVKAGDAGLTITLDTTVVGESKTATVKYVENDAKGTPHEVTCNVTYKITEKVVSGGTVTHNYSLNISDLQAAIKTRLGVETIADKTALAASDFTGNNEFITFVATGSSSSDQYRTSNSGIIEIKGDRLQVTFEGTGSISVSFASTGGGNESHFGIKDASGYLIADTDGTSATKVVDGDDANTYTVTGTSFVTVTYTITKPGTYTLSSPSGVTTRGCRISAITMQDVVEGQGGGSDVLPATITVTSDSLTAQTDAYTADVAWGDSGILKVLQGVKVNSSKKTVDGADINNRLQTTGKTTTTGKAVEIDLTGSEYSGLVVKVRVVFYVGSADTRYLQVLNSSGTEYTAGTKPDAARATDAQLDEEVTLQGGAKYYLGGSNGINIYKVVITFEKA